jgi:hypothetical protein
METPGTGGEVLLGAGRLDAGEILWRTVWASPGWRGWCIMSSHAGTLQAALGRMSGVIIPAPGVQVLLGQSEGCRQGVFRESVEGMRVVVDIMYGLVPITRS